MTAKTAKTAKTPVLPSKTLREPYVIPASLTQMKKKKDVTPKVGMVATVALEFSQVSGEIVKVINDKMIIWRKFVAIVDADKDGNEIIITESDNRNQLHTFTKRKNGYWAPMYSPAWNTAFLILDYANDFHATDKVIEAFYNRYVTAYPSPWDNLLDQADLEDPLPEDDDPRVTMLKEPEKKILVVKKPRVKKTPEPKDEVEKTPAKPRRKRSAKKSEVAPQLETFDDMIESSELEELLAR